MRTADTPAPARRAPDGPAAEGLRIEGVTVAFGGVRALSGVTFSARPGGVTGVIGPDGAGKATLFDVVTGLRRPAAGRVLLDGRDLASANAVARARLGVRRTFRRPQVFGRLTVLDNVLTALERRGGGGGLPADLAGRPARRYRERVRRERAMEVLDWCGIAGLRDAWAGSLPIGGRRMVELARAIADDPPLLLLDEPASGLDAGQTARLAEVLRTVRQAAGGTVLLVEHDVSFAMAACRHLAVLDLGRVIAEGPPEEVRLDPAVRAACLG
ncbi:ABC transporter ATP-binding protein [Nocardiopsis composta]|uniref:Branched-chain amino acid transport system ATP-binding protein n=1 Tax=Nocardiopsis composta TaxID=157465 RepID=A0A7W8QRG6_9ACTN|nr:ABC transporter ATP-binding protein [Nocardiopsis composta]MBB5435076.1 branched-chain amino acid transport system ATP-binding protein [Nocardiopsis composta]